MKKFDVTKVLLNFEGKPLVEDSGNGAEKELTLRAVLLNYLQNANLLGANTDSEKLAAYLAGLAIGTGGANTTLEQEQYDVLKKIVDSNKLTTGNQSQEMYRIIVQQQVKQIIDKAETVE